MQLLENRNQRFFPEGMTKIENFFEAKLFCRILAEKWLSSINLPEKCLSCSHLADNWIFCKDLPEKDNLAESIIKT